MYIENPLIIYRFASGDFLFWCLYLILVYLCKVNNIMAQNTSISLGNYFDNFVKSNITKGRYKNVSEVIRAGLRLLEEHENKVQALKSAIQEGVDSPRVENFNFEENLRKLKANSRKDG